MNDTTTCNGNKQASTSDGGSTNKTKNRRTNNFRLHDIVTLIEHRHDGWCEDREWQRRYFFAALPHLIVSRIRWLDAVRMWVTSHLPLMISEYGPDWIDDQARACHAKPRKCPRTDKLASLLGVQQNEVIDLKLIAIPAASRPKSVRKVENRERRRQSEQDRRAQNPDHKPRSQSKAAKARAAGTTASAIRGKAWREKQKRERIEVDEQTLDQAANAQTERVSCPTQDAVDVGSTTQTERVSCPTISTRDRTLFVPHNRCHSTSQGASLHRGQNPHAA
jgi:hypothetical protein